MTINILLHISVHVPLGALAKRLGLAGVLMAPAVLGSPASTTTSRATVPLAAAATRGVAADRERVVRVPAGIATTAPASAALLSFGALVETVAARERGARAAAPTAAAADARRAVERCWARGVRDGPGLLRSSAGSSAAAAEGWRAVPASAEAPAVFLRPAESRTASGTSESSGLFAATSEMPVKQLK